MCMATFIPTSPHSSHSLNSYHTHHYQFVPHHHTHQSLLTLIPPATTTTHYTIHFPQASSHSFPCACNPYAWPPLDTPFSKPTTVWRFSSMVKRIYMSRTCKELLLWWKRGRKIWIIKWFSGKETLVLQKIPEDGVRMVLSKRDSLVAYDIALFECNNFELSTKEGDPNHE